MDELKEDGAQGEKKKRVVGEEETSQCKKQNTT